MVKTYPGTDTIEDDIRATRRSIDDKVERIQQRLSPGDMVDSVIDFARTNGGAIAGGVSRTVRENPVPAAMIGAGIVWLALASRARQSDAAKTDGETTTDKLRQRAAAVGESVREHAAAVGERAGEIGHRARVQATRAARSGGSFVKEHPVLVGAAGIALGAAVAASLPRTKREDSVFGEQASQTKAAAKRAAVKEGRKIQEAAKSAVEKAREAAEQKMHKAAEPKRETSPAAGKPATSPKPTSGAAG